MSKLRTVRVIPWPPHIQEYHERCMAVPPQPKKKRQRYKNCRVATLNMPAGPPAEAAPEPVELELDPQLFQEPAPGPVQEPIPAEPPAAPDMPPDMPSYDASYDAYSEMAPWDAFLSTMGVHIPDEYPFDPLDTI